MKQHMEQYLSHPSGIFWGVIFFRFSKIKGNVIQQI